MAVGVAGATQVDLLVDGRHICVPFEERQRYFDLALSKLLQETASQVWWRVGRDAVVCACDEWH